MVLEDCTGAAKAALLDSLNLLLLLAQDDLDECPIGEDHVVYPQVFYHVGRGYSLVCGLCLKLISLPGNIVFWPSLDEVEESLGFL